MNRAEDMREAVTDTKRQRIDGRGPAMKMSSYGYMMLEGNTTPSERTMTIGRRFTI